MKNYNIIKIGDLNVLFEAWPMDCEFFVLKPDYADAEDYTDAKKRTAFTVYVYQSNDSGTVDAENGFNYEIESESINSTQVLWIMNAIATIERYKDDIIRFSEKSIKSVKKYAYSGDDDRFAAETKLAKGWNEIFGTNILVDEV